MGKEKRFIDEDADYIPEFEGFPTHKFIIIK